MKLLEELGLEGDVVAVEIEVLSSGRCVTFIEFAWSLVSDCYFCTWDGRLP